MKRKTVEDYKKEIVGKVFGWLTVLDVTPNPNGGHMICICKCKCGNICTKKVKRIITNHTTSCGCYNGSIEKGKKHSEYFKNHPDSIDRMILNLKKWRESNPDKTAEIASKISKWHSEHPDFLYSSAPEQEVFNYISTIYDGRCIRNSREIISPQELDLYYPDRKIAIEFNGNFWHNVEHRGKSYHINKYLKCRAANILLVSIFENDWISNTDKVKSYLYDLFNNKCNELSFINGNFMNNNYPAPGIITEDAIVQHYYVYNSSRVYTCGYSKII